MRRWLTGGTKLQDRRRSDGSWGRRVQRLWSAEGRGGRGIGGRAFARRLDGRCRVDDRASAAYAIARSWFVRSAAPEAVGRSEARVGLAIAVLRPECHGLSRWAGTGGAVGDHVRRRVGRPCRWGPGSGGWPSGRRYVGPGRWGKPDADWRSRLRDTGGEPLATLLAEDQLVRVVAAASATDHAGRWDISARAAVKLSFNRARGPRVEGRDPKSGRRFRLAVYSRDR
jgi:hypothetical protein